MRLPSIGAALVTSLAMSPALVAQAPVAVEGRVLTFDGLEPVAGASVSHVGGGEVITGEDGAFALSGPEGPHTLVVAYPGFETIRLPLGESLLPPGTSLVIRLRRAPSFVPQHDQHESIRREAEALAEATGGRLWRAEDFDPYLRFTGTALELLLASGHVSGVRVGDGGARCVVLDRDLDCAAVRVVQGSEPGRAVRDWFPSEIDSFVIIDPGVSDPYPEARDHGMVVLFPWVR